MNIRWFRTSAAQKLIKKPRSPKSIRPPKPPMIKPFTGPKSPIGFKKKLYIPKKFIMAGYGQPDMDYSAAAVANLMRYMQDGGLKLSYVEWVNPSPSDRCDTGICNELNGEMRIADISDLSNGITGWSHEGCDCHIVVTLTNGESHKITTADDMAHLQWVGAPAAETDVDEEDTEKYLSDFSDVGVHPAQQRYLQEQGLEVVNPEAEDEFENV